ncbi:MAG: helix-turn-helix protein [Kosmotogales bacterium]|nr:helix-turn-helix protein [Kosmotogales bacterium]
MKLLEGAQMALDFGQTERTVNSSTFLKNDPYMTVHNKYHEFKDERILKIKQERLKKGWNLRFVSYKTGISFARLNNLESIKNKSKPSKHELQEMAGLYGCNVEDLKEEL